MASEVLGVLEGRKDLASAVAETDGVAVALADTVHINFVAVEQELSFFASW